MIVDCSALLAILTAATCGVSLANEQETSNVVESRGGVQAGHELEAFLEITEIRPATVTTEHLEAARLA